MKKILTALFIVIILMVVFYGCNTPADEFNQELVINGNFEEGDAGWTKNNGQSAIFDIVTTNIGSDQYNSKYGEKQLELNSGYYANWLNLTREIKVVKGGKYKLQADINVSEDIENESFSAAQIGAFVGFKEDLGIKRINVIRKTDGWQTYIIYFTPVNNDTLNIQVGLGSSTSTSKGKARFDNVSVQRVESVPDGIETYNVGSAVNTTRSTTGGNVYVITLSVLTALLCYIAYILIRRAMTLRNELEPTINEEKKFDIGRIVKSPVFLLTSVLIIAFTIRLVIVNLIQGHIEDFNTFSNWASKLVGDGPLVFYKNTDTVYPPGYLYILWGLGGIAKLLGIQTGSMGMSVFLKIPAIVCELIIIYLIFTLALKHFNIYISTVFAGLYAVLPAVFTNSAAWGQIDSVFGLFVLLSFLAVLDKKYISVIVYYTIAIFLRAEALLLLPLIMSYLIYTFIAAPESRIKISVASAVALISIIVLSLPFTIKLGGAKVIFYTFGRFIASANANPVFSSNAFNFYGIFGLNMKSVSVFAKVLSWLIYAVIAFYACFIYFFKKNRAELLLLSSFIITGAGVFMTGATPQTMLMAFPLMIAYLAISGEKRVMFIFSALTLTNFLNIAEYLNQSGCIGRGANAQLISYANPSAFMIICGIINVITLMYFALVTYDICYSDDVRELEPMSMSYFKTMGDFFKGVKSIFISERR